MAKSYKDIRGPREVVYVVCPLCGRNRVLEVRKEKAKAKGKSRLRWDFWNGDSPLIQIREAGGKIAGKVRGGHSPGRAPAIGFPLKDTLTWQQVKEMAQFQDQINAIQEQIKKIQILCK